MAISETLGSRLDVIFGLSKRSMSTRLSRPFEPEMPGSKRPESSNEPRSHPGCLAVGFKQTGIAVLQSLSGDSELQP